MRRDPMLRWWAGLLGVAAALLCAGCQLSVPVGSTDTVQSSSKSFSIDIPQGTVSLSLDGKLPPRWPAGFPVAPGSTVAGSGSIGSETEAHMIAVYKTTSSGEDAFNFYKTHRDLTVSDVKSVGVGSSFVGHLQLSSNYHGSVTVTELNGKPLIIVYLITPNTDNPPVPGGR